MLGHGVQKPPVGNVGAEFRDAPKMLQGQWEAPSVKDTETSIGVSMNVVCKAVTGKSIRKFPDERVGKLMNEEI